jgi:hypothetical protein
MTSTFALRGAVCAAAILSAGTAVADVTAAQVWTDWQQNLTILDDSTLVVGSTQVTGDTLTISDIVLTSRNTESEMVTTMRNLVFVENGDGTVSIQMDDAYQVDVTVEDDLSVKLTVTQSGLAMTASGSPGQMTYDVSADKYAIALDELVIDGEKLDADVRVIANDVTGGYVTTSTALHTVAYDMAATSVDVLADVKPSDIAGDYFSLSGKIEGLQIKSATTIPKNIDTSETMLVAGFMFDGGYSYDASAYLFDVTAEGEQTSGSASTGPGNLTAAMSDTALQYDSDVTDLSVSLNGAGMPFPIEVSLARYGVGLVVPLAQTDAPADVGLRLNLTDLALNDEIWSLIDPDGAVPHDPATLIVDLDGKATPAISFADLGADDSTALDAGPGELNALTLNNLTLKLGGAELTGVGDFTFDNTDLDTFDGMPRPQGALTFNLTGANALIDSLVQMGVVAQDQAMMGRMMMGMFATVSGDDALTSKIEIDDQGQVTANGQRIR